MAKLESAIDVPGFGLAEVLKLLIGGKHQVSSATDMNVSTFKTCYGCGPTGGRTPGLWVRLVVTGVLLCLLLWLNVAALTGLDKETSFISS